MIWRSEDTVSGQGTRTDAPRTRLGVLSSYSVILLADNVRVSVGTVKTGCTASNTLSATQRKTSWSEEGAMRPIGAVDVFAAITLLTALATLWWLAVGR